MPKNIIDFFLPTRKYSQRIKDKNTRKFGDIDGGLMENKLRQLINTKKIDQIIVSTNDEQCIVIAQKYSSLCNRIKIIERPNELCLDSTNLQDLIQYVPTISDADHILWGHVTTPFADGDEYDNAINMYLSKLQDGYDSLISVIEFKNFLLNKEGHLINNSTNIPWPRTQDLEALYEINHAMFIAKREIYERYRNRIGNAPILYIMDKIKSFDIDWEDDFKIAEIIYKDLKSKSRY
jgi:N-acylneuraminate cytidylyltransferase